MTNKVYKVADLMTNGERMIEVYFNGVKQSGAFYMYCSENPGEEVYGDIGRFIEPKRYDAERDLIPREYLQGLVRWEWKNEE